MPGNPLDLLTEGIEKVGAAHEALATVIGAVGKAFLSLVELPMAALANSMRDFVGALSPASVQQFDWTMRNLDATIGSALLPAFNVLTGVVRDVAGILSPAMHALAPVIQTITQALGGALTAVVQTLADTLTGLMPIFGLLATVVQIASDAFRTAVAIVQIVMAPAVLLFQALGIVLKPLLEIMEFVNSVLADTFQALAIVVKAVVLTIGQFIAALFGGFQLKPILDQLKDAVHQVIKAFVLVTAGIAQLIGATSYLKNLMEGFSEKPGDVAAPLNPAVKGLQQIVKDLASASFVAVGPDTAAEEEKKWRAGIADSLKDILDGKVNIESAITAAILTAWEDIRVKASAAAVNVAVKTGLGIAGAIGGVPR